MVRPREGNFSTAGPVGPVYPGMDQKSVVPTWHQILSVIATTPMISSEAIDLLRLYNQLL